MAANPFLPEIELKGRYCYMACLESPLINHVSWERGPLLCTYSSEIHYVTYACHVLRTCLYNVHAHLLTSHDT